MSIAVYTIASELHDTNAVAHQTKAFLGQLDVEYVLPGNGFSDYGSHAADVIFVQTGGTEGIFRRLMPLLNRMSDRPFLLLASDTSNSLAAAMEILSFLQQNGRSGEIIHGSADEVSQRMRLMERVGEARLRLQGCRLGVIGQPSDWLIASQADYDAVRQHLGIQLIDIGIDELLNTIHSTPEPTPEEALRDIPNIAGALRIYEALCTLVGQYDLQGFTLRCFDLLSTVKNTGCLALARLNAEGIIAGCEGDVPAMLSMAIGRALTGSNGFQANPANIDTVTGEVTFAHCTIPLDIVSHYDFDTHFESGLGIGIKGYMDEGPVTVVKMSGDLSRLFVAEGYLVRNESRKDRCRTQLVIRFDQPEDTRYFLTRPIGNHHIIFPGHHNPLFHEFASPFAK